MARIGITMRTVYIAEFNEIRDSISHDWVKLISDCRHVPVFLPNNLMDYSSYIKVMKIDAVVLTGGNDIGSSPCRDRAEEAIISYAHKIGIPIIGVCRGAQMLNNYFSGSLQRVDVNTHVSNAHDVEIHNEDFVKILGRTIRVNSFHKFGITSSGIGEGLFCAGKTRDGIVELFYCKNKPLVGMMWHPERKNGNAVLFENILARLLKRGTFWNTGKKIKK